MNKERGEKDLMKAALFETPHSGAPKDKIYMSSGEVYDLPSTKPLADKAKAEMETQKEEDQKLQEAIEEYNFELNKRDDRFEAVHLPSKTVIVRLARMPHIDPSSGFVIPRQLMEPTRSGIDAPGNLVENKYPYYLFGCVVAANSEEATPGTYVQLSEDALRQTFLKEEGKWRHSLTTEFLFWNENLDEKRKEGVECFVIIKDYQIELTFNNDYVPEYK